MHALMDFGASCFASRPGDGDIIPREAAGAERDRDSHQLSSSCALENISRSYLLGDAVEGMLLPLPLLEQSPAIY